MKKTNRNQNMTDDHLINDETANTSSLPLDRQKPSGEGDRYRDANLNQPSGKTKQHYDDKTGTVENGLG